MSVNPVTSPLQVRFLFSLFFVVLLTGCAASVPQRNYVGMTRGEVASVLEKEAFRSRWSGNRFEIWSIDRHAYSSSFRTAQEVLNSSQTMKWKTWRCDFYPVRHWLLGWNGLFARWHFQVLEFENDRVVRQYARRNYYWVHGDAGVPPYPVIPWSAVPVYWGHYVDGSTRKPLGVIIMLQNDEITIFSHQRKIHAQFTQYKDDFIEYAKKKGTKHRLFYDSDTNEIYCKKPGFWYIIPERIVYVPIPETIAKEQISQWMKEQTK